MALLLISLNTAAIKAESKADLRPLFHFCCSMCSRFIPSFNASADAT